MLLGRDAAGVDQLLVAVLPLADRLDVGLEPGLLAVEVAHLGLGPHDLDGERPLRLGGRLDRRLLGQGAPAVGQLGERDVLGGEVQQSLLIDGVGLHPLNLPVRPPSRPPCRAPPRACEGRRGTATRGDASAALPAARSPAARAARGTSGPPARRCSRLSAVPSTPSGTFIARSTAVTTTATIRLTSTASSPA